jgi:hypothetical protein
MVVFILNGSVHKISPNSLHLVKDSFSHLDAYWNRGEGGAENAKDELRHP